MIVRCRSMLFRNWERSACQRHYPDVRFL